MLKDIILSVKEKIQNAGINAELHKGEVNNIEGFPFKKPTAFIEINSGNNAEILSTTTKNQLILTIFLIDNLLFTDVDIEFYNKIETIISTIDRLRIVNKYFTFAEFKIQYSNGTSVIAEITFIIK